MYYLQTIPSRFGVGMGEVGHMKKVPMIEEIEIEMSLEVAIDDFEENFGLTNMILIGENGEIRNIQFKYKEG